MSNFVKVRDRSFKNVQLSNMTVAPITWSANAVGGYKRATLEVSAPDNGVSDVLKWLRYDVTILSESNSIVWNGYVKEIVVYIGPIAISITLDRMSNRISTIYSYKNAFGKSISDRTEWTQDDLSVSLFGYKESVMSKTDTTQAAVSTYQQSRLDLLKNPVPSIEVSDNRFGARLICAGWFSTLNWRYYRQQQGREVFEGSAGSEQPIGLGFTSNRVGFDPATRRIHDENGYFKNFKTGYRVRISGSAANNNPFVIENVASEDRVSITDSSFRFDPVDDIDNLNGVLSDIKTDDMVLVQGALNVNNNRFWFVRAASADHLAVSPAGISQDLVLQTVTLSRGNSIAVNAALAEQFPSLTAPFAVTATCSSRRVAQHFSLETPGTWPVFYVLLNAKKVGNPTDSLIVELCSTAGTGLYTVLDSSTVDATLIDTDSQWLTFQFSGSVNLTYGLNYALVIRRSNVDDPNNFYMLSVDESMSYSRGSMYISDDTAWTSRHVDAQLPFQVWGKQTINQQIADHITSAGQFIPSFEITTTSTIFTEQYMTKDELAGVRIEKLFESGSSTTRRYLATTTPKRHIKIYEEPTYSPTTTRWFLRADGVVVDRTGTKIEPGRLIYGEWVRLDASIGMNDSFAQIARFFVEESEYNARSGDLRLIPRMGNTYSELEFIQVR